MSTALSVAGVADTLARVHADVDELAALDPDSCTDDEVLELWRQLEVLRRRLAPVEHAVITTVEARGIAFERGCRSTTVLARQLLHITAGEAAGRVRAAAALGPRRALTGEALAPIYPAAAAAQTQGAISARHAQVIVTTIEKLPLEVRAECDRTIEALLVDLARDHDPDVLATHARDLAHRLDQDGQYHELAHRDRQRGLTLHRRPDGSARLDAELTAECAEHLATHLDTLARPTPATDSEPDPRTPAQRRHDALLDMLHLVERAELLPTIAGISATIILTMDAESFTRNTGTARTGHGYTIPADIAKQWAGSEARIIAALLTRTKAVTAYSSSQRLFTEQQRLALIARDQGCTFPGCDVPTQWTQAHHVTDHAHGGPTSIDNATLLCGHHHRHFRQLGWHCRIHDGHPEWTPPAWLTPLTIARPQVSDT